MNEYLYVFSTDLDKDFRFDHHLLFDVEEEIKWGQKKENEKIAFDFLEGIKRKTIFPFEYLSELFINNFSLPDTLKKHMAYGSVFHPSAFNHKGTEDCNALKMCLKGSSLRLIYTFSEIYEESVYYNFRACHEDNLHEELIHMGLKIF